MRSEPQDLCGGPCWPRKPEFGGASQAVLTTVRGQGSSPLPNHERGTTCPVI